MTAAAPGFSDPRLADLTSPVTNPTFSLLEPSPAFVNESTSPPGLTSGALIGVVVTFTLDDPNANLGCAAFAAFGDDSPPTALVAAAGPGLPDPTPGAFAIGLLTGETPFTGAFPAELM